LFRILYGEEVEFTLPKDNILRASAGDWVVENVLRIDNDVYTSYVGDGETTTFYLAQQALITDLRVYENGVLLNSGYAVRKETKKLIFYTAPPVGMVIKVYYPSFDFDAFNSRRIIGTTSGASAIVERAAPRLITQQTAIELYINTKNLDGTFLNAEEITCEIIGDDGTTLITIGSNTISTVNLINVINGGASYNIGDQVPINGGGFTTRAEAVVDSISTGFVDVMNVRFGGAGFQSGDDFKGFGPGGTVVTGAINTVDTSGTLSPNTFTLFTDVISTYSSILISNTNYGFPANVIPTGENASTRIVDALSRTTLTSLGPITNVSILSSNSSSNTITYNANSPLAIANTNVRLKDFGSLGRIRINAGGQGYKKGDEVVFGANPPSTTGAGAAAAVTNVSSTGAITRIEFGPSRIPGTANASSGDIIVTGTGTNFTSDLFVGDQIMINLEARYINSITSSTSFNVNVAFTKTSTFAKVGVYDRDLIGGQGYVQDNFPSITISSANTSAVNANVEIVSIMGDSELISGNTSTVVGQIQSIRVTDTGSGYEFLPAVDLSQSGDGTATAEAVIERSYVSFPGKWNSSEGILSSLDRKLEGLNYYTDFVYVTSVQVEFSKYREILKGLLHPAGFKQYAEYPINRTIDTNISLSSDKQVSVSGRVNVNSSIHVTGTLTKFVTANSRGILTVGSNISVNNQIRTVNAITSNTSLTVSSAFTTNANSQSLIIVT
jgi:hypothetical protein